MKKISQTSWIFIAMVAGIALGFFAPEFSKELSPIYKIFINLIKSIIAPLLFATLVYGIASSGNVSTMGRIGGKAILYFEIATTLALVVGLFAVNLIQPGVGQHIDPAKVASTNLPTQKLQTLTQIIEHAFPASVIDAMAKGDVLQLVVFCFLFGTACVAVGEKAKFIVEWCESLAEVMFKYTSYVMYLAPLAVGAAIAVTVGTYGVGILKTLGLLVITVFGSLVFFVVCVLGPIIYLSKIPLGRFIEAVKEPWLIAFSTASSEAALPKALENMERFGVPKHIVSFVLPTGYSFNLDGSTLYLAAASIFCAQVVGMELTMGTQVMLMLTLMLTSKGVAGVPRASLVILAGTIAAFNIPPDGIALILGVDAILDMARTSVNLLGNCLASAVVARWEGVDLSKAPEPVAETV